MSEPHRECQVIVADFQACLEQGWRLVDAGPRTTEELRQFVECCLRLSSLCKELSDVLTALQREIEHTLPVKFCRVCGCLYLPQNGSINHKTCRAALSGARIPNRMFLSVSLDPKD